MSTMTPYLQKIRTAFLESVADDAPASPSLWAFLLFMEEIDRRLTALEGMKK